MCGRIQCEVEHHSSSESRIWRLHDFGLPHAGDAAGGTVGPRGLRVQHLEQLFLSGYAAAHHGLLAIVE